MGEKLKMFVTVDFDFHFKQFVATLSFNHPFNEK